MKKYIMIFALSLLVFTLSGCDLIQSDTIEKATEELCRENPDSKLCKIDSLDDIEESAVLNLFNNMLANIDTMDINEYCEQFISVTNIDLLDNCRTDITLLYPEGIKDFEVLSVVKDVDEYKIKLHNVVTDEMTILSLAINMENDKVVVSKMQYGPIYVLSPPNEDEAIKLIESLIMDMENETLSDIQICEMWDGVDDDCDGIEDARRKFKAGASLSKKVNILDPDDDDDGILVGEISFTLDGHVTVLKIAFEFDNTGDELKLMIRGVFDGEKELFKLEEVEELWNNFIRDYFDSTITSEKINELYFNGMIESGFMENRMSDLEDGSTIKTISVKNSNSEPDSFFDIELEVTYLGEIYPSNIKIKVNRIEMSLYMSFVDPYVIADVTYEEAITALDAYKKGYDHYSAQSATRCESYVVDFQKDECIVERDTMFENGFSLVDYKLEMSDSNYMVVFTFEDAEFNQITKTKIVYFYENGDSYLLAFYDVYMDEIDNMEVDLLLENFAMSAGDTTILTTSVCHFISGGSDGEDNDCDGVVNTVRENGYELLIGEKEDLGNNYIIELVYMNANNNYSEFYYFSFYYDADMVLKASMNLLDTKSFIYNDIYTLFGEMNDFTIPTDEVCATNIHEDSVARCISIRTFHESNGYIILISELTLDDEMNVVVHTVTYDSTGIEIEKNTFVMNYMRDANGNNPMFISNVNEGNNPLFD